MFRESKFSHWSVSSLQIALKTTKHNVSLIVTHRVVDAVDRPLFWMSGIILRQHRAKTMRARHLTLVHHTLHVCCRNGVFRAVNVELFILFFVPRHLSCDTCVHLFFLRQFSNPCFQPLNVSLLIVQMVKNFVPRQHPAPYTNTELFPTWFVVLQRLG